MAAAQVAPSVPDTLTAAAAQPLLKSLRSALAQIKKGVEAPTVSFTSISSLGLEPLETWKTVIEQASGARFELSVSLASNSVTLVPVGPSMSSKAAGDSTSTFSIDQAPEDVQAATPASDITATSASSSKKTAKKGRAKNKAPRPRNAFIIYRQDWHPRVVAENPTMHNNDISVVLGDQWRNESPVVREKYFALAEEEKRQHLLNNPGYQYQPRKPSEKKKRMTKTKLAKLKAQNASAAYDPMQEIEGLLTAAAADNRVSIETFQEPYRQDPVGITEHGTWNGFFSNSEHEQLLQDQLHSLNADPNAVHASAYEDPSIIGGALTIQGNGLDFTRRFVPTPAVTSNVISQSTVTAPAPAPVQQAPTMGNSTAAANTEADRQRDIYDDALIRDVFDLDAFDAELN